MPFYIYGTEKELHIDHMLLKGSNIQLSADRVELKLTSGNLTSTQRENGVIVHFTDVHELAMQPFPEIKAFPQNGHIPLPPSFFFQEGNTFQVELYEDPKPKPDQDGPGLDNVGKPFAKGTIRLPSKDQGCVYIDSYLINEDPTADKTVEDGKIVIRPPAKSLIRFYYGKFDHKDEPHWYEEKTEKAE